MGSGATTRGLIKREATRSHNDRHCAQTERGDCTLVVPNSPKILSGVDMPCSRNDAPQNESTVGITVEGRPRSHCRISRNPRRVLSIQGQSPDCDKHETDERLHCYLLSRYDCHVRDQDALREVAAEYVKRRSCRKARSENSYYVQMRTVT